MLSNEEKMIVARNKWIYHCFYIGIRSGGEGKAGKNGFSDAYNIALRAGLP